VKSVAQFFLTSYSSMAYDLRLVAFSCRLTYFGHTSDDLWSASDYLLMTADAR
jgi:hypothetical protein